MFEFSAIDACLWVLYFRVKVCDNRKICTTEIARRAHDALQAKLKELEAGLYEVAMAEVEAKEARRLGNEPKCDMDFVKFFFGLNWIGIPHTFLETDEPVAMNELEGLGEIIERIESEMGVIFTIDRP